MKWAKHLYGLTFRFIFSRKDDFAWLKILNLNYFQVSFVQINLSLRNVWTTFFYVGPSM